jgi:3-phosphoshikimate 1-carboxyvinyltransferase
MTTQKNSLEHWIAPQRPRALRHSFTLPGSKSLTNRELVLAALATGPSTLRRPLHSRDTALMIAGLEALGATITEIPGDGEFGPDLRVTPIPPGAHSTDIQIDCGLAGTVMRFLPPVSALFPGTVHFDGDVAARRRPMKTMVDALTQLGVSVEAANDGLPFTMTTPEKLVATTITIDASSSSQFVSGLLLTAARMPGGLTVIHQGERLPSLPHIEMTIEALRHRGVEVHTPQTGVWRVAAGPIEPRDVEIEPDLSNAAPFLAAPLITGGVITLNHWPEITTQVGADVPRLLEAFGATVTRSPGSVTIDGGSGWQNGGTFPGVSLDLSHAGELAPTLVTLATLASTPSQFSGIGHLRGHETDRLQALASNIQALGGEATEEAEGITVIPAPLDGGVWKSYEDHRMATSGALIGLAVRGVVVDDIACTHKTLPEFERLWAELVESPDS